MGNGCPGVSAVHLMAQSVATRARHAPDGGLLQYTICVIESDVARMPSATRSIFEEDTHSNVQCDDMSQGESTTGRTARLSIETNRQSEMLCSDGER